MCCQIISLRTACECLALSGLFWPVLADCDLKSTLINHPKKNGSYFRGDTTIRSV